MQLDDHVVRSLGIGRVFKDTASRINSIDYHRTEDLLVTGADDDSIHVYDTQTGQLKKTVVSRKYGVSSVAFTHHGNAVLFASTKSSGDQALRYLSLHDNKCVQRGAVALSSQ